MNQLEQIRHMTVVVADTGDFEAIKAHSPTDATTNPSLILKAADKPQYRHLIEKAVQDANGNREQMMEKLFVNFGIEILKVIPGRVSTEVDAHLSFDVEGSIQKAHSLIRLYEAEGIPRERILIKLASTWEGIVAAKQLESEGIHCNMTLMFSIAQAIACGEVNATLISPFVGRILDWYKKHEGVEGYPAEKDPGVLSVRDIYNYLKKFDYNTEVMGASFRNKEEIIALAGCDLLTISPELMEELKASEDPVERKLDAEAAKDRAIEKVTMDEKTFRLMMNEDAMATEKLAEGIRNFAKDATKLENRIVQEFAMA